MEAAFDDRIPRPFSNSCIECRTRHSKVDSFPKKMKCRVLLIQSDRFGNGIRFWRSLEDSGYTLVGGVRYTTRKLNAEAILTLGPARDRCSTLVETLLGPVIAIGSAFEDQRRLVSRNGSFWRLPVWELCNDVPIANPRRLDETHTAALDQLRGVSSLEPGAMRRRLRNRQRISRATCGRSSRSEQPMDLQVVSAQFVVIRALGGGSRSGFQRSHLFHG